MTVVTQSFTEHDLAFTDSDFRNLADLAQREFGLNLSETKKPLVYSRLSKRLSKRGLRNFSDYLTLIDQKGESDERMELVSALTTNVTAFFREKHHFELLKTLSLPKLKKKIKSKRRARLWSAGCSSGQEPYSIAMTLLEAYPEFLQQDIRILATDIDPKIISKARTGLYSLTDIETVSINLQNMFMTKDNHSVSMDGSIRSLIRFAEMNLISDWPFRGPFDAIFCRNVAIYFDQNTQERLWQRFVGMLEPGGLLFIGHSERISGTANNELETVGITSYRKK